MAERKSPANAYPPVKDIDRLARGPMGGIPAAILALFLIMQSGCQVLSQFRPPPQKKLVVAPEETGTLEGLLRKMNERTSRVNQLKTSVRVATEGMPGLRGDLMVERPNRMRLKAGLMGMDSVGFDLGSNADAFWIWQRMNTPEMPETFYYARHIEYQQSPLLDQLQLQPGWLIDGLGLVEFSPADRHEGPFPAEGGRARIRSFSHRGSRSEIRETTYDPRTLEIHQQSFYNERGVLVAWINSTKHREYPEHQVSLPGQIEINVVAPGSPNLVLEVSTGNYDINRIYGDPERLWTMPRPEGVRVVNLAGGGVEVPQTETATQVSGPLERGWLYR